MRADKRDAAAKGVLKRETYRATSLATSCTVPATRKSGLPTCSFIMANDPNTIFFGCFPLLGWLRWRGMPAQFSFTNSKWDGQTGCVLTTPCSSPCTAGSCGNWDTWTCLAGAAACSPAVGPPSPPVVLSVSRALGSHMVLQREVPNTIWGTAAPGVKVTVAVLGPSGPEVVTSVAADNATWQVCLKLYVPLLRGGIQPFPALSTSMSSIWRDIKRER